MTDNFERSMLNRIPLPNNPHEYDTVKILVDQRHEDIIDELVELGEEKTEDMVKLTRTMAWDQILTERYNISIMPPKK